MNREVGEVNYYLTQFFTGHGLFRGYLKNMGKVADVVCSYGDFAVDDAKHTFFECVRWTIERDSLEQNLGSITPENIVDEMPQSQSYL